MVNKSVSLLNTLKKRYSTKVFNPDKNIDKDKFETLLKTIPLTPSAINSQPWHVFVISDQQQKERLAKAAWEHNKAKFINANYLFVFCSRADFSIQDYTEVEELTARIRKIEIDLQRISLLGDYIDAMDNTEKQHWLKKQVYIMLGQFLTSCAILELDACPIEGFLVEEMDNLLELSEKCLTSVVCVAVGCRTDDDFNQLDRAAKIRFSSEEILTILD